MGEAKNIYFTCLKCIFASSKNFISKDLKERARFPMITEEFSSRGFKAASLSDAAADAAAGSALHTR